MADFFEGRGYRSSLAFKAPCRVATTENVSLSGLRTLNGVTLAVDDRVLVKNQDNPVDNGIYVASTGPWQRAVDFDGNRDIVKGTRVYVHSGDTGAGEYQVTTSDPVIIGTSGVVFEPVDSGAGLATSVAASASEAAASAEAAAASAEIIIGSDAAAAASAAAAALSEDAAAASAVVASGAMSALLLHDLQFATLTTAQAYNPETPPDYIRTAGYSAVGDGGGALYKRVDTEPAHAGKFQSADGTWWEYVTIGGEVYIEQFGGKADWVSFANPGSDNTQALADALSLKVRAARSPNDLTMIAPRIKFRIGNYHFASTIELRTLVHLLGVNSAAASRAAGTNFCFPADTAGVIVQQTNTSGTSGGAISPFQETASGSIIEGITFQLDGTDTTKHGIQFRTAAIIRRCYIVDAPGNAIHIEATSGSGTIEGNASGWVVDTCTAEGFGLNGLYVAGADANAGRAYKFWTRGNAGNYGCGIYDSSWIGNTYLDCELVGYGNQGVHYNGVQYHLVSNVADIGGATTPGTDNGVWYAIGNGVAQAGRYDEWVSGGDYKLSLPIFCAGNGSRFFGTYIEASGAPPVILNPSVSYGYYISHVMSPSLGGVGSGVSRALMSATGVGGYRRFSAGQPGREANGSHIWAAVGTMVGHDPTKLNLLEHRRQIDGDLSWEWKYETGETTYGLVNSKKIWRISTPTTADKFGRDLTPVPHMFTLTDYALRDPGSSSNWRIHGIRSALPTAAGEYARGELYYNAAPSAGGFVGWVCTTGGCIASAWVTGTNYALGSYIKAANGRFYRCTAVGGASSTVEPTHSSGATTELDGFEWTYVTTAAAVFKGFGAIEA